jgi:hypothetical protein
MTENKMKTSPYNEKLHKHLLAKRFKYTEHVRYDRYDNKDGITIFYYPNNYIMILDPNGEPVRKEVAREIMEAL